MKLAEVAATGAVRAHTDGRVMVAEVKLVQLVGGLREIVLGQLAGSL